MLYRAKHAAAMASGIYTLSPQATGIGGFFKKQTVHERWIEYLNIHHMCYVLAKPRS